MSKPLSLTAQAHQILHAHLSSQDIAIDATAGNGHDTLFLAQRVQQVFAFDIQTQAITTTRQRLESNALQDKVSLFHCGHQLMEKVIPDKYHGQISTIMFNLGYLPGGNKHIITQAESSCQALSAALRVLKPHGLISLLVYPGHPGGDAEFKQVQSWLTQRESSYLQINTIQSTPVRPDNPVLYILQKLTV